ncbi:hypothetical protein NHQ30_009733 [Ciborinia camelliae]|nr:hypothetical protein NHQ30_009733 [Ciborinia camelliae]
MTKLSTPPSDNSDAMEKAAPQEKAEHVETHDERQDHSNDDEKNGLRTYCDEEDHDHEPKMSFRRFMSFVSMAFLWTGSQIPVYIFGAIPSYIYSEIGGLDRWIWFILAHLLALAGVCPFVGSLSDILGRRYVALLGAIMNIIGMIVCSTAHTMNIFIGGMAIAGVAAGINETGKLTITRLTALAATSELAPTSKRGKYIAILVFTLIPFCPSVMWGQLIASRAGWRWCGFLCGIWSLIGFVLTLVFYFPPPRVNSMGLSNREVIQRIDFVGGFLSISGMILFMAGMQWGGHQYEWTSAHVLVPLLIGAAFLAAFCFWEVYGAKYPMFPSRLKQAPRTLILTLVITFISGANFFSIIMFWPNQAHNVYGHDPIGVGVRGLPVGFSILAGACIVLWLLSVLRGRNKELMIASSVFMTAGCGSIACANRHNLSTLWALLIIAGLGIGGIVVPASIITTIICPDDLIATIAALTLSIRVLGGSIGYCVYYNIFVNKFAPAAILHIGGVMARELNITNKTLIGEAIKYTASSVLSLLKTIPGIAGNETAYEMVVIAGQDAYAESYVYVYYASTAFGAVSILAACFLGDISAYMDDHVAVIMH